MDAGRKAATNLFRVYLLFPVLYVAVYCVFKLGSIEERDGFHSVAASCDRHIAVFIYSTLWHAFWCSHQSDFYHGHYAASVDASLSR